MTWKSTLEETRMVDLVWEPDLGAHDAASYA